MKNILIIGATGQIGSELTMLLRKNYTGNVVAGYIPGAEPKGELKESGPSAIVDITNPQQIADAVNQYHVDTIYNLAALLSAVAETSLSWLGKLDWVVCSIHWKWLVRRIAQSLRRVPSVRLVPELRKTRPLRIPYSVRRQCMV